MSEEELRAYLIDAGLPDHDDNYSAIYKVKDDQLAIVGFSASDGWTFYYDVAFKE